MKEKKEPPHRQIQLVRPIDKGWEGMSGRVEMVGNVVDESSLKVGADYNSRNHTWQIAWIAAQIS